MISGMAIRASWLSVCAFGITGIIAAAPQQKKEANYYTTGENVSSQVTPNYYVPASGIFYQGGNTNKVERGVRAGFAVPRSSQQPQYHSTANMQLDPSSMAYGTVNTSAYQGMSPPQQPEKRSAIGRLLHWPGKAEPEEPKSAYKTSRYTGLEITGSASWYGSDFHGRKTANGERYDMNSMTAAHRSLPFGTLVKVTNLNNGNECIVRINNRGPYVKNRMLDLSKAAARDLGLLTRGVGKIKMTVLGRN